MAGRDVDEALRTEMDQISATTQINNARQDALDRVEQICGEGRTSCLAEKIEGKVTLGELGLLPPVGSSTDCTKPSTGMLVSNPMGFFDEYGEFVTCSGDTMVRSVGGVEFENLPRAIYDASIDGTLTELDFSEFSGEYKIALLELKNGIVDIRFATTSIKNSYQTLKNEIKANELNFAAMELEVAAHALDAVAHALDAANQCWKCNPIGGTASVAKAAAAACRAVAQQLKAVATQWQFLNTMLAHLTNIEQQALSVEKAATVIQQNLERLELLELEQGQSVDKADRMADEVLAKYVGGAVNQLKAFRRMTIMADVRARRSVRRAKRMAFIARRALEMKMAVNLASEKESGINEEPPAKWADDLYTMMVIEADPSDPTISPQSALVGYIQRLEDYVYNYPFQYPFADGQDTAVISLRDDLSRLNENCLVPGNLKNIVDFSEEIDRWDFAGGRGTITMDAEEDPFGGQTAERVRFTCGLFGCPDLASPEYLDEFGQSTSYAGSVYLKRPNGTDFDVSIRLVARYRCTDDWETLIYSAQGQSVSANLDRVWQRVLAGISGLRLPDNGNCSTPDGEEVVTLQMVIEPAPGRLGVDEVHVSGAQIEQGERPTEYEMSPTYGTHTDCITVTVQDPWSTDPNDTVELTYYDPTLRTQRLLDSFSAKCVDDQFAVPGQSPSACASKGGVDYMERQFTITLDGIESGAIVQQGQIGGGNYNYRISDLAINLVGSNVKDCSLDPGAGTTCYANQFIPYDMVQDGAVKIRNHAGVELPFKLSVGRIHQAKGLAAERLMTNPLSSTDSALIGQYRKNEFRGRPIQGVYTLRIHAVPSLRWTNIEDVQIVLGYRYWSAFSTP